MKRPKLLFLTSRPPYPLHGGDTLRAFRLSLALAREFDVTLLAMSEECASGAASITPHITMPAGPYVEAHFVHLPRWRSALQAAASALGRKTPIQVAYYQSAEVARHVHQLSMGFDAVACHLIRTAPYAMDLKQPKLLEFTDALSMFYQRVTDAADTKLTPKTLVYRMEQPRVLRYELEAARGFDVLSFASEVDRQWLIAHDASLCDKAVAAPNGVVLQPWHRPAGVATATIAFVGNMRTLQNQDAVFFFASEVLPMLSERLPTARLRVIGSVPPGLRDRLQALPRVEVAGIVDNLGDAFADCLAGVCPMRLGAGIQNKVLDYMSHSLPVVSSSLGMAGLGTEAVVGRTHLQADTPQAYVDAFCALFQSVELRESLSRHGHDLVRAGFDWDSNLRPVVTALRAKV